MSRIAYPYLRPSASVVDTQPWSLVMGDEERDLPSSLDDWDYNLDLRLRRIVVVDGLAAREQCLLPAETPLALCVVWRSTGSGLFGRAAFEPVKVEGESTHILDVTIAGADVGGTVDIDTLLVLPEPLTGTDVLAPHRAGSMLWEDRASIRLQGDASQFPIAVVDFEHTSLPDDAGWHLEISGSLDSAAMGALLLLVNQRNTAVADAFSRAAKPRPVDRMVLSAVYADVSRTLVDHALARDDFVDGVDYGDDTLGAVLLDIFGQMFGGRSIQDVRLRAKENRNHLATEVQAAVRIFGSDS